QGLRRSLSLADQGIAARGAAGVRPYSAGGEDRQVRRLGQALCGGGLPMTIFLFHLMPYAPLDLDFDKKYPSSWMALPNSYYDPKQGHILYNRYLDELELADQLGFEVLCVNEHHQTAYGLMATPGVLAGALSRRTKRAKIAGLRRALALRHTPRSIA